MRRCASRGSTVDGHNSNNNISESRKKMLKNKSMTSGILPARKQLKRVLFCLLALSALVLLAACGGGSTGGTTPTASTGGTTPTTGPTSTPAATATATQAGNSQTVMIITDSSGSFAFSPASLTIKAGTTVVWKNTTAAPHTVTSDDGKTFDSGSANPIAAQSGTFSFTFNTAGTFAYHCAIHPFMTATIIVQ
jgi:plastocyanin